MHHFAEAKGILSANNGMNVYRGCQHGCIYCDARSVCYQMKHKFEDIEVKQNAPELLEKALIKKKKKIIVGTGAMSDPYIPLEKELRITRKCLEIIAKYRHGVSVLTKSDLILRDIELLIKINENLKCVVQMTLTAADEDVCRIIEPGVCGTLRRAEVLKLLSDNGIPVYVWFTPILPFINDTEDNIKGIVDLCRASGVKGIIYFGAALTLREGDREYFYDNLDIYYPGLKKKYISEYGNSYVLKSPRYNSLNSYFHSLCKKAGINSESGSIFAEIGRINRETEQTDMFGLSTLKIGGKTDI